MLPLIFLMFLLEAKSNYILNGGFEDPAILPSDLVVVLGSILGWSGEFDLKGPLFGTHQMNGNQYVDLSTN